MQYYNNTIPRRTTSYKQTIYEQLTSAHQHMHPSNSHHQQPSPATRVTPNNVLPCAANNRVIDHCVWHSRTPRIVCVSTGSSKQPHELLTTAALVALARSQTASQPQWFLTVTTHQPGHPHGCILSPTAASVASPQVQIAYTLSIATCHMHEHQKLTVEKTTAHDGESSSEGYSHNLSMCKGLRDTPASPSCDAALFSAESCCIESLALESLAWKNKCAVQRNTTP